MTRRIALLLALLGCSDVSGGESDRDMAGVAGQGGQGGQGGAGGLGGAGGEGGGGCEIEFEGACLDAPPDDREAACDYVASLPTGCVDADGDCLPGACDPPLPAALAILRDCDDARPDVHGYAEERCDLVDDDCDGEVDEDFPGVGDACNACGEDGKIECSVTDPRATACSTEPGQSAAGPVKIERCDGVDDDCDGRIDEDCAIALADAPRATPSLCGARVVFVQDGAVWAWDGEAAAEVDPGPAAAPTCSASATAWLDVADAECQTPSDGPTRCVGAHLRIAAADEVRDVTGIDALGAPVIAEGFVYWHAMVGDLPTVKRTPVASRGDVESPLALGSYSDPTRASGGQVGVRAWNVADAPRVQLRGVDGGEDETLNVWQAPGPPALSPTWLVFAAGAGPRAIWAVPRATPGDAFQIAAGPVSHPRTDGDWVAWRDAGPPATLQLFDLGTGLVDAVAHDVPEGGYDLHDGALVWLAPGPDGPTTMYRRALPPAE